MQNSAMRGVPVTLQNAAVSGNGTVIAIPNTFQEHRFMLVGSAGIAAGAVQPEAASSPTFAGTWQAIGAPVTVPASTELDVSFEGIFAFVRCRISTPFVAGTVTVSYIGS
jgi:hypothetical protein